MLLMQKQRYFDVHIGRRLHCPSFATERRNLNQALDSSVSRENLVSVMLSPKEGWLMVASAIVKIQEERTGLMPKRNKTREVISKWRFGRVGRPV